MMEYISFYGWHKLLTPELAIIAAVTALLYAKALHAETRPDGTVAPLPVRKQTLFYLGLVAVYLGYGSPLTVMGREAIDFYVIQLCIRYLVMVPLLVSGMPGWLRRRMLPEQWMRKLIANPGKTAMIAAPLFFFILSCILYPAIHNAFASMILTRLAVHALLLACAWTMWESLLRLPRPQPGEADNRFKYLVIGSLMLLPICFLLMTSESAAYIYPQSLALELCLPPVEDTRDNIYMMHSSSYVGGLLLLATQQLSFSITTGDIFNYRKRA